VDNITGTAVNDTIDGSRAVLSGQTLNTLGNSDVINGGEGTDTLNIQIHENLTTITPTIRNVETLSVECQQRSKFDPLNLKSIGRKLTLSGLN
jgi:hypothetical protein